MAYGDFTLDKVEEDFGLVLSRADLFPGVTPHPLEEWFLATLLMGVNLAADSNTEVAKSTFVVGPILLALKRVMPGRINVFAGVEFNVDRASGLNGVCDFLISKGNLGYKVTAPILTVVEAKNDNIGNGLGQCVAEMVAAQRFNKAKNAPVKMVFGVVTVGTEWRFMRLIGNEMTFHENDLLISSPELILGILVRMMNETLEPDA